MERLNIINKIIEIQKEIIAMYIKLCGEDAEVTQNALARLGKYVLARDNYIKELKVNV